MGRGMEIKGLHARDRVCWERLQLAREYRNYVSPPENNCRPRGQRYPDARELRERRDGECERVRVYCEMHLARRLLFVNRGGGGCGSDSETKEVALRDDRQTDG